MKDRSKIIAWDVALLVAITICIFVRTPNGHFTLIFGIMAVQILSFCIQKHIAVYKLTGKIY